MTTKICAHKENTGDHTGEIVQNRGKEFGDTPKLFRFVKKSLYFVKEADIIVIVGSGNVTSNVSNKDSERI